MKNLSEHLEMRYVHVSFNVRRMNVFIIVDVFSLSDHIQLIHWNVPPPPKKIKIFVCEFEIPFEEIQHGRSESTWLMSASHKRYPHVLRGVLLQLC